MSAGHHHRQNHTSELIREVKSILGLPEVKAYLGRPYVVDYSREIPLTGGSSRDGGRYYIDPRVPLSLRPFVLRHERVEKAVRDVLGKSYSVAHRIATGAERIMVEESGRDWEEYKRQIAVPVRQAEKERPKSTPKDLDIGPYKESGEMRLLRSARGIDR